MRFILLSTDLMLIAAAQGAADRRGVALTIHASVASATDQGDATAALAMIDLRTPGLNITDAVRGIRLAYDRARIVACGPHVHKQSLQAAVDAGCDEVITRGEFERRVDGLLAEVTASASRE